MRISTFGSIILVILITMNFPMVNVHASQVIQEIQTQEKVYVSTAFPVKVRVRYDFDEESYFKVWAGIRDPGSGYIVAPKDPPMLIRGKGELTWNFSITSPLQRGDWFPEAYAIYYENNREIHEASQNFKISVVAFSDVSAKITKIQTIPATTVVKGEKVSIIVSINYNRLIENTVLRATIKDGQTEQDLGQIQSDPLEGDGNYTFKPINITVIKSGEWPLRLGIGMKDCPTGLCGIQEFFDRARFSIYAKPKTDGNPTPIPSEFKFSINVDPTKQSLNPGKNLDYNVHIDLKEGDAEQISLNLTGAPKDSIFFFEPQFGIPPFNSKLTIYIPQNTPPDSYTLTVMGISRNLTETIKIELKVEVNTITTTQTSTETPTEPSPTISPQNNKNMYLAEVILALLVLITVIFIFYYLRKKGKSSSGSNST